ncbi:MAG: type II secretion system protein [Candidatus Pacebacteria bacterium]|nr:type II secretion system protein [Candidatus Paceibacterota bacterium]MDR3583032.1 type II secretion system protein [Candidatus Paceibacterota bacterium]
MKNKKKKNKLAGFSLIEMIVAMAIAVIIMLAVVAAFAGMVKTRNTVRDEQQDLENARNAMDTMAKELRFSSDVSINGSGGSGKEIAFYDNSSLKCTIYRLASGKIQMAEADPVSTATDPNQFCHNGGSNSIAYFNASGTYRDLTSVNSGGMTISNLPGLGSLEFNLDPQASTHVGKATILMTVDGYSLQTTVSFRNYSD